MTSQPSISEPEEQAAAEFCRGYLRRLPHASYKEVRREAWAEKIRVTRRTFSSVQRELSGGAPLASQEPQERSGPPGDAQGAPAEKPPEPALRPPPGGKGPGTPAASPPREQDPGGRRQWHELFGAEEPPQPAQEPASEGVESPTDSARRALGLLSPPAAADEPRLNAVEFMAGILRENPEATYRDVRDQAEAKGYTVSSATFGRAQAISGILAEAESEEAAAAQGSAASDEETARSRPPARSRRKGRDAASLLEEFIEGWEEAQRDREQLRQALEAMLKVVEHALETPKS